MCQAISNKIKKIWRKKDPKNERDRQTEFL
jgi:hypothetical protein